MKPRIPEKNKKPGVLYLIPTPIGNLKDITLRAIEVLKEVDEIYSEDTREATKLLKHYGIEKKLLTYLGGYERKVEEIIKKLLSGLSIGFVSDRGTPCINDYGYELVQKAHENGIRVVSLPGPNAAITALAASGFSTDRFLYLGFLPKKGKERIQTLKKIAKEEAPSVFYESPKRLVKTLEELKVYAGENRECVIARELTKIHEEIIRGTLKEVLERFKTAKTVKGEFVVIVGASECGAENINDAIRVAEMLKKEGLSSKKAARIASMLFSVRQKEVYEKISRS